MVWNLNFRIHTTYYKINHRSIVLLSIPLILSAFTHLFNPVGFPPLHSDEGHYMRRAMQVLKGMGPQESPKTYPHPYDHPYFGQLLLWMHDLAMLQWMRKWSSTK
jgi:hypothetical protein